jgi:RIO kinase 1
LTAQDATDQDPQVHELPLDTVVDDFEDDAYPVRHVHRQQTGRKAGRFAVPLFRDSSEEGKGRIIAEIDEAGEDTVFKMTYPPAKFEAVWLRSSLRSFFEQDLIVDVVAQVKGGKEANVYRCLAHPRTGVELLAAKVYRPRQFRNLSNDQLYREGRQVLTGDGRPAKATDQRIMRALGKKTAFGVQVGHTSWLMHEYTTLGRISRAGGAVPSPVSANENALLMSYQGDARRAAPSLQEVRLGRREATPLFREVLRNVELLLQHGLVHGDLSAYNILYWEGEVTLIDFPQVTEVRSNRNSQFILQRDVKRVCEYFARQGISSDAVAIADDLWERYGEFYYPDPVLPEDDEEDLDDDDDADFARFQQTVASTRSS